MVAIPLLMEYGAKVAKRTLEAQGGSFVGNSAVLLARSAIAAVSALVGQTGLSALAYPTGLTRGVVPKVRSHSLAVGSSGMHVRRLRKLIMSPLTRFRAEYPFSQRLCVPKSGPKILRSRLIEHC